MQTRRMFASLALLALAILLLALPGATSPSRALAAQPQVSAFNPSGAPVNLAPAASLDNAWFPLGDGLSSEVDVIVPDGDNLYVGGNFSSAGTIDGADHVARWNGSFWQALAPGLNNAVYAILVDGSNVYVGGFFTDDWGGGVADHIVRWDGSSWQLVGNGLNGAVFALAKIGTDLYVGGDFTNAGGIVGADNIARWDGSAWHAVGNGPNDAVLQLAVIGTDLYASGVFTSVGSDSNAQHIARWDGSSWHPLGTGLNDFTGGLAVNGTDLYAGGYFTNAGGVSGANFFARWDGATWHTIGGNPPPGISSIGFAGTNIYVASFRPYRWDGSTWQDLAPTFSSTDRSKALAVTKNGVYIGGNFTDLAGNAKADNIALWQAKHLLPDSIVYSQNFPFLSTREIRLVDANGGNDQLLFNGTFPRLSPDRNSIVFKRGGNFSTNFQNKLYLRNLANNAEQLFFDNDDFVGGYDWTNDSGQIVFDYSCEVDRSNADGTGLTTVLSADCYDDAPASSPWDGSLAVHNQNIGIRIADKNGVGLAHVPNTHPGDFWPVWSPDGQWISFVRGDATKLYGGGNYFKIHPNGSGLTQLTFLSGDASNHLDTVGAWDSQKDHIVAPGTVNGRAGMYAFAANGSGSIARIPASYGSQADFVGAVIGDVKNWLYLPGLFR